jgi:hypothetical protein
MVFSAGSMSQMLAVHGAEIAGALAQVVVGVVKGEHFNGDERGRFKGALWGGDVEWDDNQVGQADFAVCDSGSGLDGDPDAPFVGMIHKPGREECLYIAVRKSDLWLFPQRAVDVLAVGRVAGLEVMLDRDTCDSGHGSSLRGEAFVSQVYAQHEGRPADG